MLRMSCKVLFDYRYLHRKNFIVNVFRIIANPLNTSFELSHHVHMALFPMESKKTKDVWYFQELTI